MRLAPLTLAVLFCAGCRAGSGQRPNFPPASVLEITELERAQMESRTLSHLAALEAAVGQFIKQEGRAPARLEDLIPKYIDELPPLELGFLGHKMGTGSRLYPPELLQGGEVDGARLEDSGLWGYAGGGLKGVVFVDCAHETSRSKAWYRERGVY